MYTAYNKLYFKGKPTGRKFKAASGRTREEALELANKSNAQWNRHKGDYKTHIVEVSSDRPIKKKRSRSDPLGTAGLFDIGF